MFKGSSVQSYFLCLLVELEAAEEDGNIDAELVRDAERT